MIELKNYIEGLNEFINSLDEEIMENTRDSLENYQENVLRPITPVDTGLLYMSYNKVRIEGKYVIISNRTHYSERILWFGRQKTPYSKKLPDGLRPSLEEYVINNGGEIL